MKKNAVETDRRRVKKLVEGKNFDFLIMSLICMDAVILGLMTSDAMNRFFEGGLFILDRLFMAIFIIEMIMKIFAFGKKFFKSGWNVFDFAVIAISSVPFASWFIIFRTFRLFRLLRYVNKFTRLKQMINTFLALLPNFMAMLLVMAGFFFFFFYVFAIMAVCLFGDVFIEFSDLGSSLFALLQGVTLDGWASNIARPVMAVFPHSWLFFVSFVFISFLITVSFLMSVVSEVVRRAFNLKSRL